MTRRRTALRWIGLALLVGVLWWIANLGYLIWNNVVV